MERRPLLIVALAHGSIEEGTRLEAEVASAVALPIPRRWVSLLVGIVTAAAVAAGSFMLAGCEALEAVEPGAGVTCSVEAGGLKCDLHGSVELPTPDPHHAE